MYRMLPAAAPRTKLISASGWPRPALAQGEMKKGAEKVCPRMVVLFTRSAQLRRTGTELGTHLRVLGTLVMSTIMRGRRR